MLQCKKDVTIQWRIKMTAKDFDKRKIFTVASVQITKPKVSWPDIDYLRPF